MTIATAFSTPHDFEVEVVHDALGGIGTARLEVGGGKGAWLTFPPMHLSRLSDGVTYERLVARTKNGKSFTLLGCQYQTGRAFVDFVVEGDVEDRFASVRVRFTRLTEWFLVGQRLQGNAGERLTWVGRPSEFNVGVDTNNGLLTIQSSIESYLNQAGDDTIISDQVWVSVTGPAPMTMVDVRERCRELSIFFTTLLVLPVDIVSVVVTASDGRPHSACFGYYEPEEDDSRGWHRFLLSHHMAEDRWKTLLDHFYRSDLRKVAWTKLSGMLRHDGFWEFGFFGYASILEAVVKAKATGKRVDPVAPGAKVMGAVEGQLKAMTEPLDAAVYARVVGAVEEALTRREKSFAGCYGYAVSVSDPGVVRAINLTADDFELIKELRNAIAHGGALELTVEEQERLPRVVNKMALLLTYWAWLDFGLSDADFLESLHQTSNRLVGRADICRIALDRALGRVEFHTVPTAAFDALPAKNGMIIHGCFRRLPDGGLQFNAGLTSALADVMRGGTLGMDGVADALGVAPATLTVLGQAYIESGERIIELISPYIIDVGPIVP